MARCAPARVILPPRRRRPKRPRCSPSTDRSPALTRSTASPTTDEAGDCASSGGRAAEARPLRISSVWRGSLSRNMRRVRAPEYKFLSRWRIEGAEPAALYDIMADEEALPRWWPAVSLGAEITEPGDENGVGREVRLHMKGWLTYTMLWQYRVGEARQPC